MPPGRPPIPVPEEVPEPLVTMAQVPSPGPRSQAWCWGDVYGLAWVVALLGAYLSPALWDGFSFGPSDIANQLSLLTYAPHLAVHNGLNGDIITQKVPWNALDWLAVHHGQLPLWNRYSGDGMPLMLNFEATSFSLPTLVGYLFPLSSSFLVGVAATLLVAGTGTYAAARLAGIGPLGAALAGTTFMLSGSLSGWAGWAVSGPSVWAGWLLAGVFLCWRPRRGRFTGIVVVAISSAFAVYGGFPETLVLVGIALGTFVLVGGAAGALRGTAGFAALARLLVGVAGGAALSAPLWMPGLAVLNQSTRASENGTGGLPLHTLALLFAQGYDGLPTSGSTWFGPVDYYEATAYVGVVALVLALVSLLVDWRRPTVLALAASVLVSLVIIYLPVTQRVVTRVGAGSIATQRMLPMLAFSLAMLAGIGAEVLQRRWREPGVQLRALASLVACGVALSYLILAAGRGTTPAELSVRRHALVWPGLTFAGMTGLLVLAAVVAPRSGRLPPSLLDPSRLSEVEPAGPLAAIGPAGMGPSSRKVTWQSRAVTSACILLLATQSAYLVWAGIGLNSYFSKPFHVNQPLAELKHLVGGKLVALDGTNTQDVTLWTGVGLYPEVNIGYSIRELAIRDPVIPRAYLPHLASPDSHSQCKAREQSLRTSRRIIGGARYYGASFVLAFPGRVPKGTQFVAKLATPAGDWLALYRVPGATQFSFAPGNDAKVLSAKRTGNASWRLVVDVRRASALTLRLTYFPGWHVTAGGRALAVHKSGGLFLGVAVAAGTRTVTVNYWPAGLTAGFILALAALAVLLVALAADFASQRLSRRPLFATAPSLIQKVGTNPKKTAIGREIGCPAAGPKAPVI